MPLFSHWVRLGLLALMGWGPTGGPRAEPPPDRGPPLLVVVETGPGVDCDADEVRAAIAAELGVHVIALTAPPVGALAGPRTDTLVVAIDRDHIVVILRGRAAGAVTRTVAAPADRTTRLLAVASLADRVLRDSLVSAGTQSPTTEAPDRLVAPRAGAAATVKASDAPSARVDAVAPPAATPAPPERSADDPLWTFTLSVGTAAAFTSPWEQWIDPRSGYQPDRGSVWRLAGQLEAHRHLGPWFAGAAVDVGPRQMHPLGVALLAGVPWRVARVRLEASGGLGLEAFGLAPLTLGSASHAATYARAAFAVTYPLSRSFDVVGELVGHLTATKRRDAAFVFAAFGLRWSLPEDPAPARAAAVGPPTEFPTWTLSASAGPAVMFSGPFNDGGVGFGTSTKASWSVGGQLEAHRHFGAPFAGVAIEVGPRPFHPVGAALVVGRQVEVGPVRLEASGGLGEEVFVMRTYFGEDAPPPKYIDVDKASPYARGVFAASRPLAPQLDLLAELGGHLTLSDRYNAGAAFASLGVRLVLP